MERFSFYVCAAGAREKLIYNKDYQTELRIFISFEVVDTVGSSQVLFWYQDFPSKSNGSQFTGIYVPRAGENNKIVCSGLEAEHQIALDFEYKYNGN